MNTPSHLLMTVALQRAFRRRIPVSSSAVVASSSAVVAGSIAPDVGLFLLSAGAFTYFHLFLKWSPEATYSHIFGTLYFQDYGWMITHNLLHAPLIQLPALAALWRHRLDQGGKRWWLFWFFAACAFHTAVDLATHFDDGPLPLFPFDFHTRIHSPVSYWDPAHYGRQFVIFEIGLDLVLILYLVIDWLRVRRAERVISME